MYRPEFRFGGSSSRDPHSVKKPGRRRWRRPVKSSGRIDGKSAGAGAGVEERRDNLHPPLADRSTWGFEEEKK